MDAVGEQDDYDLARGIDQHGGTGEPRVTKRSCRCPLSEPRLRNGPPQPSPALREPVGLVGCGVGDQGRGQDSTSVEDAAVQQHLADSSDVMSRSKQSRVPSDSVTHIIRVAVVDLTAQEMGPPAKTVG